MQRSCKLEGGKKEMTACSKPLRLLLTVVVLVFAAQTAHASRSVSQHGITWTFDRDYATGQFANGDWWVVGPVTITGISPQSERVYFDQCGGDGGGCATGYWTKNGSMVNPSPTTITQGYDSELYAWHDGAGRIYETSYSESLNIARKNNSQLSAGNSRVIQPGSSLISSISSSRLQRSQINTMAILTVLGSPPPAGSFRPPYCGTNKTIRFNKSQLDYSALANLRPVAPTPAISTVAGYFEKPWIDHIPDWKNQHFHPIGNMPSYAREMSTQIGEGTLLLNCSYTTSQKETLLVRLVQLGIDNWGIYQAGGTANWTPNGGHASGRKFPILFAGLVLGNQDMTNIGFQAIDNPYFGPDAQTFYVTETSPGVYNYGQGGYTASDVGLPEWGIRHATKPSMDNKSWGASYRQNETANSWAGFLLAARIMGAKDLWNHDALFDYQDRYMQIQTPGTYNRQVSKFAENMWDAHRASFGQGGGGNPINQPPTIPQEEQQTQQPQDDTIEGTIHLQEDFSGGDYNNWLIYDDGDLDGPSKWIIEEDNSLVQYSRICSRPFSTRDITKQGTRLIWEGGYGWSDYSLSMTIRSDDRRSIGVIFRCLDNDNYYRFGWNSLRRCRRLVKKHKGQFTVLAEDRERYETGRSYQLQVNVCGDRLAIYIDGTEIFTVNDDGIDHGTIGLYSWRNTASCFDDIVVSGATDWAVEIPDPAEGATIMADNFSGGDYNGWDIIDSGDRDGPSQWGVDGTGTLVQSSRIYGRPMSMRDAAKEGTYALWEGGYGWSDYSLSMTIRSDDRQSIGVMFRCLDNDNYYRFDWNSLRRCRRLVKKHNGEFTVLAEDRERYESGRTYQLRITAYGVRLMVHIDGVEIFNITDLSMQGGTIGLYSWRNTASCFDNVIVNEL